MANWTDIPDARLEPGAPARSVDALALRDNTIAQAEGAIGAPKTQTEAIQDQSITVEKFARYVGAQTTLIWRYTAGLSTSSVEIRTLNTYFVQGGVYTMRASATNTDGIVVRGYLNGVNVYDVSQSAGSADYSPSVTVNQGDEFYMTLRNTGSGLVEVTDMKIFHEKVVPINVGV